MAYSTTAEVEKLCKVPRAVLAKWEDAGALSPLKDYSGYRLYSQRDIDTIFRLRYLIYTKGLTLDEAKAQLARDTFSIEKNTALANDLRKMRCELGALFFEAQSLGRGGKGS